LTWLAGALAVRSRRVVESPTRASVSFVQYVTEDLMHGLCLERNFYVESGAYISDGLLQLSTWGAFAE
jgi:hypothetical protein